MKDYYTLTTRGRARRLRDLAQVALAQYDLHVTRIRLIDNDTNGIFRLDCLDGTRYMLRVSLAGEIAHSLAEIRSELMWLDAIRHDTNLIVPEPLRNRAGTFVTTASVSSVPEARHCSIFSWIPGRDISEQLTPVNLEKWGAFAAQLHQHGAVFKTPPDFSIVRYDRVFPFDQPIVLFDEANRELLPNERLRIFESGRNRAQAAIDRLRASGEPMRVLHGDLHLWNVKVARGRIAAFDFEDLMWGWPIQDIATTLYYFHGQPEFDAYVAAFKRGYTQYLDWPEAAPRELDTFILNRALILANDVLVQTEWREEAVWFFPRTEKRLRAILDECPFLLDDDR